MNEKQKEELLFEIRTRIMNIESVVIATAKYLANVEDVLVKLLTETDTYKTLLEQLTRKE
jgi:hypothetical protein